MSPGGARPAEPPASERARVAGAVRFAADVPSTQALHAAFALSTEPHARLLRVDTSRALALPGVVAAVTGADIGQRTFGRALRDYPVLAVDRVLFAGQRLAAVAAWDAATARAAAELVDVDYEPLDPVLDPAGALGAGAAELHPGYASYEGAPADRPAANVQGGEHLAEGEPVSSAFDRCAEIYEHAFSWPRMHSAPLEPHGCLVVAGTPQVHVWSAHKEPYALRRELAAVARRPEGDFVVHHVKIGGDFGAKGSPFVEAACYFLSVAAGRPVRTVMTYFEELTSTSARHPGSMRLRTGLRDGAIHAHEADTLLDGGAFAAVKPRPTLVLPVVGLPLGPYAVPHRDERSTAVYTNNLPGGQVRSPGEFQATFAGESHVDIIARARGEDPIAFRLRHATAPGTRRVLEELRGTVAAWRTELGSGAGIGVAVFERGSGAGRSRVRCEATPAGVRLSVGAVDQGAGTYPTLRRLAAGVLQVPEASVTVSSAGADPALTDSGAGASRVTAVVGRACAEACRALLAELGAPPAGAGDGETYWIGARLDDLGLPSAGATGSWSVARSEARQSEPSRAGLAVEVAVDRATGAIAVRRALLVADTGPVLNPVGHRGQLEGGFVYGLSQALFEELAVEEGHVVTASLGDYKLASAADVPPLELRLLAPGDEGGGADPAARIRPVGELANLGAAPAVANAVDDAVGVRVRALPITGERVWRGLRDRRG